MKQFFQTLPWKLARLEFYKKKPFTVTCTVIFSVLLALDLAIAVFVPSTNSIGGMQGFSASDMQEIMDSTEFDMSNLPGGASSGDADSSSGSDTDNSSDSGSSSSGSDGESSGSMPSGDMPDMSDSDFSGNMGDMPSGDFSGDMGDMPSGDASGGMSGFPGGSDSSSGSDSDSSFGSGTDGSSDAGSDSSSDGSSDASASDGMDSASAGDSTTGTGKSATRGSGIMGFLRGVKSHWVLLAVIFAILDLLSIVRLVIISRHEKEEREQEAKIAREKMLAGEIVHTASPARKYKKTNPAAVWAIPMVGVLLLVAIVNGLSAGSTATVESTSASVYSGTAETTTLDTVLSGAGTLEEEDAESLELNSTVEISTWYVSNGDTVAEGDTLASVDKVSVMSAIASLQAQLEELDAQLAEYETEEIDDTITAASDGRVMAIYAEEGTSVVDTMYDYGSLLLLSIDGYLAVDLETEEELQAGDSVIVILSDDTEVTGKVGTYLDGVAVILVSDEDASLGEEVSVETEDGEEIGSGSLYIHSQLAVTGYLGTVDEISVEVGDEVENGDTLLTLTDTEYAGTYETLLAQRSELEEEMQELFTLYQDPYLYASCAGVVSGIEDASSDSSSADDSDSDGNSSDDNDSSSSDDSDDSSASAADAESTSTSIAVQNSAATAAATATVCTVSSGNTSGSTTATASTLTSSSDTSGTAVTTSTSNGYDNYIGVVQSVDDDSATASVLFLTGVYEITDYSDLSDYDLSTDNMTESHTIDRSIGTIMFTYSSSGLTVGTAADIAAGDILVISYESGGSPGLGSTPIWIVRVVEDSSEDESGDTASDSDTDSSTSGSDTESDSTDSSSDSSSSSGSSGSSSGSDTSGSSSSGSSSGGSSSSSGSDSTSGSSGSGSDSTSGSSGRDSGSDSTSGSSATGSGTGSGNASGNSDYSALEGSMGSDASESLDSGSSDTQGTTDSNSALDSFTGSTDGSESSGSMDSDIVLDGTSSSTDLGSLYSDSSSGSASSGTDASGDSSSYSLDTSSVTDSTLTDSTTDAAADGSDVTGTTDDTGVTSVYTVSKTTLVEITPQDTMTITITIDELDILSLEEGQTAQVTLDAFPGQAFEGEVTAIDFSGTNSGGSTKFTAEVTIAREDDMLAGMNASAVITIDTTEDVLCIPEDALVETDGVCYVYTTYDEKNEELGGLVEVTTGLSDGENVEILSGLGEGDSYYYSILDVVNYSTSSASSGSSFSMDSLFSSGGMGGR